MTTRIRIIGATGSALAALFLVNACGKNESTSAQTAPAQTEAPTPAATAASDVAPMPPNPNDQLTAQLRELGATQKPDGLIVDLTSADFEPGQTKFDPSDSTRIDRIAQMLKDRAGVKLLVRGFTDSHGSKARNTQLSQERADAVRSALVERGADSARIRAEGRGEEDPVANNDTVDGRKNNRRVEIVFSDAEGLFAARSTG